MALQKIPGRTIQLDNQANSDVMYFDGTDWVRLAKGEAGQVLTVNETATAPQWGNYFSYGGTEFGYCVMGIHSGPTDEPEVDKFSFTSDGNAVHHCDAFSRGSHMSCTRSTTHGYVNGGEILPHYSTTNRITKFSFASTVDGTDVGDLLQALGQQTGNSSGTHGYCSGGQGNPVASFPAVDTIQKYSVTTDANATDVGNLTVVKNQPASANSQSHGYVMGMHPPSSDIIEKFSFSTDGNSTDVANLSVARGAGCGCTSETHGYMCAGLSGGVYTNIIDKFEFATDGNSVDVGDLPQITGNLGGSSSTTHGYCLAGYQNWTDRIQKFSFSTGTQNASNIGDLVVGREMTDGTQN